MRRQHEHPGPRHKDPPRFSECVQALALVQLAPDPASEFLVRDVAAEVEGAHEAAVFLQRSGE